MTPDRHLLVVDDDEDIRELVSTLLRAQGYRVDTARDGVEALAFIRHLSEDNLPSTIMVDLMMPRMDGEGLIRVLRADPRLAGIPIVIMSGHQDAAGRASDVHAAACLVKPIELDDLFRVIDCVSEPETSTAVPTVCQGEESATEDWVGRGRAR